MKTNSILCILLGICNLTYAINCSDVVGQWSGYQIRGAAPGVRYPISSNNTYSQADNSVTFTMSTSSGPWIFTGLCYNNLISIRSTNASLTGNVGMPLTLNGSYINGETLQIYLSK